MWIEVRVSRTAVEQLSGLGEDEAFEAWNELRKLQHGDIVPSCPVGEFGAHRCPSARLGFRVSRPRPRLLLVWSVLKL